MKITNAVYIEIHDRITITAFVWLNTIRTTVTRRLLYSSHETFSPLYLLFFSISLDLTGRRWKRERKKRSLWFYGLQRRGRRFQSSCTTRLNRPNQISVHAMSVKFNSRSISAFGSRPSIIPSFIASSQVIRRDVEVLFKKKDRRKRKFASCSNN